VAGSGISKYLALSTVLGAHLRKWTLRQMTKVGPENVVRDVTYVVLFVAMAWRLFTVFKRLWI
jgi:hypothetical protein